MSIFCGFSRHTFSIRHMVKMPEKEACKYRSAHKDYKRREKKPLIRKILHYKIADDKNRTCIIAEGEQVLCFGQINMPFLKKVSGRFASHGIAA